MIRSDLPWWLLDNAGPVIRFRTMVEILGETDIGLVSKALEDLFNSPIVTKWLELLKPRMGFHNFHSSMPVAFGNVMGKLVQLGLHAGLQAFDTKTLPFRAWLSDRVEESITDDDGPGTGFSMPLVASYLAYAGYDDTKPVKTVMLERLERSLEFAETVDFDEFYVKGNKKEWLVSPRFYVDVEQGLPYVHDIRGIASSKWIFEKDEYNRMAERVIATILSPEYQGLKPGYGYLKYEKRTYTIGSSVHVPGFSSFPTENEMSRLLLCLEMMAPFMTARESNWFQKSLDVLEEQVTDDGHYRFPRKWLPERQSGYWVGANYMALEDERRKQSAIDYESTFRVLKIKQLAGLL
ncbi:MAG: hypothetical protein JSW61_02650 [Candidatus Thorarchaeota archaeon]|nr:MAG: hypothetical protein JSW61_02650 [Candidatus Thorarchaeota archaeon]